MTSTNSSTYLICPGSLIYKLVALTSVATEINHPYHSPVHIFIPDQQDNYPQIRLVLPNGKCIGFLPFHLQSFLLDLVGNVTGVYKSKPAGGWNPTYSPHHPQPTFFSSSVRSLKESGMTQYEVTTLIFIKRWEVQKFKQKLDSHHISIEIPPAYSPQDHLDITLQPLSSSTSPNWKSAYPDMINLSPEDLAKLKAIPSGSDLKPVTQVGLVTSPLRPHQQQGLGFLLDRENPHNVAFKSLWQSKTSAHFTIWTNLLCGEAFIASDQQPAPASPRASILADDMGLGKSIQTIALIAHTLDAAHNYETGSHPVDPHIKLRRSHTTLLICPKGLMDNWEREIEVHTNGGLKVMRWHDPKRATSIPVHGWYPADVIITTLGTLQRDRAESLMYSSHWFRVVIDEAHIIRNETFSNKCVTALHAVNRLCLTGTPLHNRLGDLHMMLKFLHMKPFNKDSVWDTHIAQPVQRGNLAPVSQLLRYIMLRRTKNSHILDLPPVDHTTIVLDMHPAAKELYQTHYKLFLSLFGVDKTQKFQGGEFFKRLTNLRMACNHPLLFRENEKGVEPSRQPINEMEATLGIKLPDARNQTGTIPLRDAVTADWKLSKKLEYLVHKLQMRKSNGGGKSVIYTQWKTFIDWIIIAFDHSGIKFRQLHGDMTTLERTLQLQAFTEDPMVEAFIVSIEAGSVGLNMTCADEVYLMDAHWNPQIVQQAVDRLHRIGQTKPVRAFHVVTGQSIEQHLYNVQKRKAALARRVITVSVPTEALEESADFQLQAVQTGSVADVGDPNLCYNGS